MCQLAGAYLHLKNFNFNLKGQCHEIFDPRFFHQTIPPRALIHVLKPFRMWLRIRRENLFQIAKIGSGGVNNITGSDFFDRITL
jgi:hypothetical protein